VNNLEELKFRLSAWLDEFRRLDLGVFEEGATRPLPTRYTHAFSRFVGWYEKFGHGLLGDGQALRRLKLVVSKAKVHPSEVQLHQISICLQDASFGAYKVSEPTSDPDGPVGGELDGAWRHGGKIISGLGRGKAFRVFYEANLTGINRRIQTNKFGISPKLAVRGVSTIIEKIESTSGIRFPWQLEKVTLKEVLVVPRKPPRGDRGTKRRKVVNARSSRNTAPLEVLSINPVAKPSGKSAPLKSKRFTKKVVGKTSPAKLKGKAKKPGTFPGT